MRKKQKIAILTNFMEFNPGYSLTGIVQDQVRMLVAAGYEVHLFVNEQFNDAGGDPVPGVEYELHKKITFLHLIDYKSAKDLTDEHRAGVEQCTDMLAKELVDFDIVFTHDFVFTGWFLPYGMSCIGASRRINKPRWLHWIHSVPSAARDWWNVKAWGPRHKLVYPNKTDALRLAESYRGELSDVRVIPHIKDLRSWMEFDSETCNFIDDHPGVMQADVVQVLPASTDRLTAKRIDKVILLFSRIKKLGMSVCLVIANQWATTRQQKEDITRYLKQARRNGLEVGTEVIFTSEWKSPKYDTGIPRRMLRELFMCSNLFIFPTREESFGLVVPEAALSGGVLLVLNKSLTMQMEITGMTTLYADFGSYHQQFKPQDEDKYFSDVARIILGRMRESETLTSRTFIRQHNNWTFLYNRVYAPVMAEAITW